MELNKEQLIEMGGKLWEKGNLSRVYINDEVLKKMGFKIVDIARYADEFRGLGKAKLYFDCNANGKATTEELTAARDAAWTAARAAAWDAAWTAAWDAAWDAAWTAAWDAAWDAAWAAAGAAARAAAWDAAGDAAWTAAKDAQKEQFIKQFCTREMSNDGAAVK